MVVLLPAVVLLRRALAPYAVLELPLVLLPSAPKPVAVLELPVVLSKTANTPAAVLLTPVVLFKRAPAPVAVLSSPVLERSVPAPIAVLRLPIKLLWSGKPTNRRIVPASSETKKRVVPLRGVAAGIITAIGWRGDSLRCR